jgi:ribonucleoside-diphosphate reductase beta chain
MSVFNVDKKGNHLTSLAFLDPNGGVTIQRYDTMKYPFFDRLTESQHGFFWRPAEVDLTKDSADFKSLSDHEKHIFTSNLKRQILLDSVQGRAPSLAFLPCVSLPEIETWIQAWTFSETIHSKSYTHIIRNVYADPSIIFDQMSGVAEIIDCAKDISFYYDEFIRLTNLYQLLGDGDHNINGNAIKVSLYELKKALWMTLMSVNILEGVRFFVSFACSWSFAEVKKMEGNAKIIKLICRDENLHLAATQMLLKILPKDDADFVSIAEETKDASINLFRQAVDQEKVWAQYLFKDGSIIGLNEKLLSDYIEWIANKRMTSVDLPKIYATRENPLPFTQRWIAGNDVQIAPQESEIQSYVLGATKQDVSKDTFSGFKL